MAVRKTVGARRHKGPGVDDESEHHHVSIRKIDNGFILSKTTSKGDKYSSNETYHDKKPTIDIQSIPYLGSKMPKTETDSKAMRKASQGSKPKNT